MLILAGGALIASVEPGVGSYGEGVWWAIVTTSTVGYGDITPENPWGRLTAGVLMIVGVGVIATVATSIAAYFVESDEGASQQDLAARLERIERKLDELTRPQEASAGRSDP